MSHRSFRSTLVPIATGLAAVLAVSGAAPAFAASGEQGAPGARAGNAIRAQEWWLSGLHVTQTWPDTEGAGITVAVLGTGVAAGHPDLKGAVSTGPDYTGSGRTPGGPYWGVDGTAVAGVIAGHGHDSTGRAGLYGVAPMAKILSVRVDLEFNDPLNSDRAIARRLPGAIAAGITYAVNHGARIIDLPIDPGTLGLSGHGDPAAAGGSPAERAAVNYALSKNVVLVAPAGDDGQGPGLVNYPAAYPGVLAVGAVGRDGQVAPFSSRRRYVSLTAPGVKLVTAGPSGGYSRISSTSVASGIVAGVAALVVSRYPHLTQAQVTQALIGSTAVTTAAATTTRAGPPGTGHGTVDAGRAIALAAAMVSAGQARQTATPGAGAPASPQPARPASATPHQAGASNLAGSLVRAVVAGLGVLILLLIAAIVVMRSRRDPAGDPAAQDAARPRNPHNARGQHEQRKPESVVGPFQPASGPVGARPPGQVPPGLGAKPGWQAPTSWSGGGVGEMASSSASFRPVIAPVPKAPKTSRAARSAAGSAGPPWDPAPLPERTIGPLPVASSTAHPPDPGPGIRVPGDMAAPPAATDVMSPVSFGVSPDPDFPPRPALEPGAADHPTHPDLSFAAAPVPADYAPPQAPDFTVPSRAAGFVLSADPAPRAASADPGPGAAEPGNEPGDRAAPAPAADPSYIWDLAATDVFPAAADPGQPEAPGAVPSDGDPGASSS